MKKIYQSILLIAMMLGCFNIMADRYIYSVSDLQSFRDDVNGGNTYSGQTIYLCADLDLSGISWTPIGNIDDVDGAGFQGTFNGQGHKVSNFNVSVKVDGVGSMGNPAFGGFFGLNRGIIKNLAVYSATIYAGAEYKLEINHASAGGVVGINRGGVIANCVVSLCNITSKTSYWAATGTSSYAAGIAGSQYNGTIENCYVTGNTITANKSSGNAYTNAISNKWSGSNTQTNCCTSSSDYASFRTERNYAAWLNNNIPGHENSAEPYSWDSNGITPEKHFALNVSNNKAQAGSYRSGVITISPTPGTESSYVWNNSVNVYPVGYVDSDNNSVTYMLYPYEACNSKGTDVNVTIGLEGEGSSGHEMEALGGYNFVKRNGWFISSAYLTNNYLWDNDSYSTVKEISVSDASAATDKTDVNSATNRYLRSYSLTLTSMNQPLTFVYETVNKDEYEVFAGEMKAYQLLSLTDAGKSALSTTAQYLTYNSVAEGKLYLVNADGSSVVLSGDALTAAWNLINNVDASSYYVWTAKSWVTVELPEEYLAYSPATDASAKSVITTTGYNLNVNGSVVSVAPLSDTTFGYVCENLALGANNFSVSMNYNQLVDGNSVAKVSDNKSVSLTLVAPSASSASEVSFTIYPSTGTSDSSVVVTDESGNEFTVDNVVYNSLKASLSFDAPNVDATIIDAYDVVYVPVVKAGSEETSMEKFADVDLAEAETLNVENVDPTVENIVFSVETRYYPKVASFAYSDESTAYVAATVGNAINVTSELPTLTTTSPEVNAKVVVTANEDATCNVAVNEASANLEQKDIFNEVELTDSYYDFEIEGATISGLQSGSDNNFGVVMSGLETMPEVVTIKATPVYVFATGDSYVALRGEEGVKEINSGTFVDVDSVVSDNVVIRSGKGFVEIVGSVSNQLYNVAAK